VWLRTAICRRGRADVKGLFSIHLTFKEEAETLGFFSRKAKSSLLPPSFRVDPLRTPAAFRLSKTDPRDT